MPSQEHEAAIKMLQSLPIGPTTTLPEMRKIFDGIGEATPLPGDVKVEAVSAGGVKAEWVRTGTPKSGRVVLHLHGGGYVQGSCLMYREFAGRLSRVTEAPVLVLDYRLAPENPHPAAVDDAVAAYEWLLKTYKADQIIITGDSAGGGLTIATMLKLKEKKQPLPKAAVCISPWVDLTLSGATVKPGAVDDPIVTGPALGQMAQCYAKDLDSPLVSPLHGNLDNLPPMFIFVGTREVLLDDARRLNAAAKKAGVKTEYFEGEGLVHCWPVLAATAPETTDVMGKVGKFAAAHW